jgi:hypothetical protein
MHPGIHTHDILERLFLLQALPEMFDLAAWLSGILDALPD